MKRPSPEEQEIAEKIGLYFLQENKEDYEATAVFLQRLGVANIQISETRITIELARPGLLIGGKGKNIFALQTILGKPIHIFEVFSWADVMTPYNPSDEDLGLY